MVALEKSHVKANVFLETRLPVGEKGVLINESLPRALLVLTPHARVLKTLP